LGLFGKIKRALLGPDPAESLAKPFGVASSGDVVYVTDTAQDAVFVFDLGRKRFWKFGRRREGILVEPIEVVKLPDGKLCVSDAEKGAVHFYDSDGRYLRSVGYGSLQRPTGLAVDADLGRLYVVDTKAHKVVAYTTNGDSLFEFGGRGDGKGQFYYPTGIAVGPGGKIFVVDTFHFAVQVFSAEGRFLFAFGRAGRSPGLLARPKDIAVDRQGRIYVTDSMTDNVQIFDGSGRLLLVLGGSGDGPGQFSVPAGITLDREGRLYVVDSLNKRVQMFRMLTEAGGGAGYE